MESQAPSDNKGLWYLERICVRTVVLQISIEIYIISHV